MTNEYVKSNLINGNVKSNEYILNEKVVFIDYYLDISETELVIRQLHPEIDLRFHKNEVVSGEFKKYDTVQIDLSGTITDSRIIVYNANHDFIYEKAFKVDTGEVWFIEKTYYDTVNDITYDFSYDPLTGNFLSLSIIDPFDTVDTENRTLKPADIGVGNNDYDFSWVGFEYYQNALPVLPTT
ncbi:hypothetical protein [Candidatus Venteria ishoeyi]|nr:hypothetical protein [Candidatus Venteria ishoeyi]